MKKLGFIFGLIISFSSLKAQMYGGAAPMCQLNSGDVKALANVKKVNIVYDYSAAGVGAFRNEEDYLKKKGDEMNEKKPGTGDQMRTSWNEAKKAKYEPKFQELFNKTGEDIEMQGENYATANEVTLTVKTTFMEPGVNIGIYKKPAYVDMECVFTDKAGKELASFFVKNSIGSQAMGFDYDVSSRLVESYAKAAKMLVGGIKKERKKSK
jgi:hypothetical protein